MTAEEFTCAVLEPLHADASHGHSVLDSYSAGEPGAGGPLREVSDFRVELSERTAFLLGQEPQWSDIHSGRAVERENDQTLLASADRLLLAEHGGLLVVTGTAGSGKSTALKRLAARLVARGERVAWIDRDIETPPASIRAAMRDPASPRVLAVDDADSYGGQLSPTIREVLRSGRRCLVIVAIRSGRIDRVIKPQILEDVESAEIAIPHLGDRDIDLLIDALDRDNRLGVLKGKSIDQQRRAFRDQAGRQLLVAMIQATSGKRFEEKAADELRELEAEAHRVYALVSVASSLRFDLAKDEVCIAAGGSANEVLNALDRVLARRLVIQTSAGAVRSRHRVIAEIVRDDLQRSGELLGVLSSLVVLAAAKVRPGTRRSGARWRFLRNLLSHEFLLRVLDVEAARNIYGEIEDILSWDYHYWLQRGSLEVEAGDLALAENYLLQSRGLADEDPFVTTEWAYLLLKKATENPRALDSAARADEAIDLLEGLIAARGGIDSYPYHVLGSQGLSWSRRGIQSRTERERFLRKLLAIIESGHAKHPQNSELRILVSDIRREYLSLAVK